MDDYAGDETAPPDTIPVLEDDDPPAAAAWGPALEGLKDATEYLKRGQVTSMSAGSDQIHNWKSAALIRIPTTTGVGANRNLIIDSGFMEDTPPDGCEIEIVRTKSDPDRTITIQRMAVGSAAVTTMAVMPTVAAGPD